MLQKQQQQNIFTTTITNYLYNNNNHYTTMLHNVSYHRHEAQSNQPELLKDLLLLFAVLNATFVVIAVCIVANANSKLHTSTLVVNAMF